MQVFWYIWNFHGQIQQNHRSNPLTHWDLVMPTCISELGHHWLRLCLNSFHLFMARNYVTNLWITFLGSKHSYLKSKCTFFSKNAFENVICKMTAIISGLNMINEPKFHREVKIAIFILTFKKLRWCIMETYVTAFPEARRSLLSLSSIQSGYLRGQLFMIIRLMFMLIGLDDGFISSSHHSKQTLDLKSSSKSWFTIFGKLQHLLCFENYMYRPIW